MAVETKGGGFATPEAKALAEKFGVRVGGPAAVKAEITPVVYVGQGNTTGPRSIRQAERRQVTKSLDEMDASFYSMNTQQVAALQERMVGAGILDPKKVRLGDYDDDTFRAWQGINQRAARFYAVGQHITPMEVLGMIQRSYTPRPEEAAITAEELIRKRQALEAGFSTSLHTLERSDPASVRQTAEAAFKQALGRKPRKDEMDKFVSNFLGSEASTQQGVFNAQDQIAAGARARAVGTFDAEANAAMAAAGGTESGGEADILWQRLQKMIADAPGRITPGPRSRDYATQVRLWNNYKAGKGPMAAKPGTSKHGNGRANDLTYENDAVRAWALKNAGRYGLAFPIYNPKLSRSRDESWHIEVAGGSAGSGHAGGKGHAGHVHGGTVGPGAPPVSQTVDVQRQDAGAQAVEFARAENPTETKAYDIGQQFQSFLSILSRGVV